MQQRAAAVALWTAEASMAEKMHCCFFFVVYSKKPVSDEVAAHLHHHHRESPTAKKDLDCSFVFGAILRSLPESYLFDSKVNIRRCVPEAFFLYRRRKVPIADGPMVRWTCLTHVSTRVALQWIFARKPVVQNIEYSFHIWFHFSQACY